jgi:hypothetical protein
VWVLLFVLVLVVVGLLCYWRKHGAALRRNQKMEINTAVSNYFEFANERK